MLFDNMEYMKRLYKLAAQLKGAPLKEFPKRTLREELGKAPGSELERTRPGVTKVLHATPAYIDSKDEFLEDVNRMVDEIRRMTEGDGRD
jgi:hypothetical protein